MNASNIKRTERRIILPMQGTELELGCGAREVWRKNENTGAYYLGIDIIDYGQPIVWDFDADGIPLPDNSCMKIYCSHTMEHLHDFIGAMNECWRALEPGGELYVIVPHKDSEKALVPSHVRLFDRWSWDFFQYPAYAEGYQSKVWEVMELIINERKDMHIKLKPKK